MDSNEIIGLIPERYEGKKSICILGAGISGLSLAYYLLEIGGFNVVIFEKESEIGGNCRTYQVNLDADKNLVRWADMGVNDYNKTTYTKLNSLMAATGYVEGNSLEDTEAYGNSDGSLCYTNDGACDTKMPDDILADSNRFKNEAYNDLKNPKYAYYTLSDYITEKKYSTDYVYKNLYPRVNGMYFCGGAPGEMSFRAVMSYYGLQEGYNNKAAADRRYFKGGTISWINSLADKIKSMAGRELIIRNYSPEVVCGNGLPGIKVGDRIIEFDAVVLGMHADDAIKCFSSSGAIPKDVLDLLIKFQYITDESIVHTDVRSLQPQINSWRTYNIHAYDFDNNMYGPYTITYVANRHQNDCQNPLYKDQCENPQFLVAVNPVVKPADNAVLQQPNGQAAKTVFRHQKLSIDTIPVQEELNKLQGKYGLWYANGYVSGAGLHEECIVNAMDLSRRMSGLEPTEQYRFDYSPGAAQFAPDYIASK